MKPSVVSPRLCVYYAFCFTPITQILLESETTWRYCEYCCSYAEHTRAPTSMYTYLYSLTLTHPVYAVITSRHSHVAATAMATVSIQLAATPLFLTMHVARVDHSPLRLLRTVTRCRYKSQGKFEEAEPLFTEAIRAMRVTLPDDHSDIARRCVGEFNRVSATHNERDQNSS